jgi:hypothetical protein
VIALRLAVCQHSIRESEKYDGHACGEDRQRRRDVGCHSDHPEREVDPGPMLATVETVTSTMPS